MPRKKMTGRKIRKETNKTSQSSSLPKSSTNFVRQSENSTEDSTHDSSVKEEDVLFQEEKGKAMEIQFQSPVSGNMRVEWGRKYVGEPRPEYQVVNTEDGNVFMVMEPNNQGREVTLAAEGEGTIQGNDVSSFEALCQAAKSELQNISKSKGSEPQSSIAVPISSNNNVQTDPTNSAVSVYQVMNVVDMVPSASSNQSHYVVLNQEEGNDTVEEIPATQQFHDYSDANVQYVYTNMVQSKGTKPIIIRTMPGNEPVSEIIHHAPAQQSETVFQYVGGRRRKHPAKPGRHICPYCGRGCAKPSVLEKHIRAHTGERPYPCDHCGISFKTKSNLYKHCKSRAHHAKVSADGSSSTSLNEQSTEFRSGDESNSKDATDVSTSVENYVVSSNPQIIVSLASIRDELIQNAATLQAKSPVHTTTNLSTAPLYSSTPKPTYSIELQQKSAPSNRIIAENTPVVSTATITPRRILCKPAVPRASPIIKVSKPPVASPNVVTSVAQPICSVVRPLHTSVQPVINQPQELLFKQQEDGTWALASATPANVKGNVQVPVPKQALNDVLKLIMQPETSQNPTVNRDVIRTSNSPYTRAHSDVTDWASSDAKATTSKRNLTSSHSINTAGDANAQKSHINTADVTARISNLIDANQAIVNSPLPEPLRTKRVVRQRSEMVLNQVHELSPDHLSAQRINRAHSMDVSMYKKDNSENSSPLRKSASQSFQDHRSTYVTITQNSGSSNRLAVPGPIHVVAPITNTQHSDMDDVEDHDDSELDNSYQDESGDAVQVLQQLQPQDDTYITENDQVSDPQTHGVYQQDSEYNDVHNQSKLYNFKCDTCNKQLLFADEKSINDHLKEHEQNKNQAFSHSQSVIEKSNKRKHPLRASNSLDNPRVKPKLRQTSQNSTERDIRNTSEIVIEMVDPTQPPKRGRPKGSRNLPKGQSSTESENDAFYGTSRPGAGKPPGILSQSGSSVEINNSLDLGTSSPFKDINALAKDQFLWGRKGRKQHSVPVTTSSDATKHLLRPHSLNEQLLAASKRGSTESLHAQSSEDASVRRRLKDSILLRQASDKKKSAEDISPPQTSPRARHVEGRSKEIVRQTRSLDDSPPSKRPRLTRQQSFIEPTSSTDENNSARNRRLEYGKSSSDNQLNKMASPDGASNQEQQISNDNILGVKVMNKDGERGMETSENVVIIENNDRNNSLKNIQLCINDSRVENYDNMVGETENALRDLYGVTSCIESSYGDHESVVTNKGIMPSVMTPPTHASLRKSRGLQTDKLPSSVAVKIPGMVRVTESMELEDATAKETVDSEAPKSSNETLTEGIDEKLDGRIETTTDTSFALKTEDKVDEVSKADGLSNDNSRNEVDVITNTSTYTVNLKDRQEQEKAHVELNINRSDSKASEDLIPLSDKLKGKSEIVLTLVGHNYPQICTDTHTTLCSVHKPQPMYVTQDKQHPKLSMYSTWRAAPFDPNPAGLTTKQLLSNCCLKDVKDGCYGNDRYLAVAPKMGVMTKDTKSEYWVPTDGNSNDLKHKVLFATEVVKSSYTVQVLKTSKKHQSEKDPESGASSRLHPSSAAASHPLIRAQTDPTTSYTSVSADVPDSAFARSGRGALLRDMGYKSEEVYTYIRGRGRGKYVCNECGIRCKKPSMLKKHIRTHTDLRPFVCKHCSFAFKTKGNLTKHMKSKSHFKKCSELGVFPIPTSVDDSYIEPSELQMQTSLPVMGQRVETQAIAYRDDSMVSMEPGDLDEDELEAEEEMEQEVEEEEVDMDNMVVIESPPQVTNEKATEAHQSEPRYIAVQNKETGHPMLLKLTVDEQGHTRSELVDIRDGQGRLRESFLRDSTDKEVAASLLDLAKRTKKYGGAYRHDPDSQPPNERLGSLIGKLSHRTGHEEETGTNADPSFAVINHPMLYTNSPSKQPEPLNQSDVPLQKSPAKPEASPSRSGFIPPAFSEEVVQENVQESGSLVLKIPHTDNLDKKALDDMIGNILKQVEIKAKQKIVLEIQMSDKGDQQVPAVASTETVYQADNESALLSSQSKDDFVGACVNPQEIHSNNTPSTPVTRPPLLRTQRPAPLRLTDSQIRQMDPSLQDEEPNSITILPKESSSSSVKRPPPLSLPPVIVTPPSPSPRRVSRMLKRQASFNEADSSQSQSSGSSFPVLTGSSHPVMKTKTASGKAFSATGFTTLSGKKIMIPGSADGYRTSTNQNIYIQQGLPINSATSLQQNNSCTPVNPQVLSSGDKRVIIDQRTSQVIPGKVRKMRSESSIAQQSVNQGQKPLQVTRVVVSSPSSRLPLRSASQGQGQTSSTSTIVSPLQGQTTTSEDKSNQHLYKGLMQRKNAPVNIVPIPGRTWNVKRHSSGQYECHICQKLFPEPHLLHSHLQAHQLELPYRCKPCNTSYRDEEALHRHLNSTGHMHLMESKGSVDEHNPRPFNCDVCDIGFRTSGHLAKHLRSNKHITCLENMGKIPMGTAKAIEDSGIALNVSDAQIFWLDILSKIRGGQLEVDTSNFQWPVMKEENLATVHDRRSPKPSSSATLTSFSQHPVSVVPIPAAVAPHKCGLCPRRFANMIQLKEHLVSHAELRPYVCEVCDAGFTTAQSLDSHLQSHKQSTSSAMKGVACSVCHVTCDDVTHLVEHLQRRHGMKAQASAAGSQVLIYPESSREPETSQKEEVFATKDGQNVLVFDQTPVKVENEAYMSNISEPLVTSSNDVTDNEGIRTSAQEAMTSSQIELISSSPQIGEDMSGEPQVQIVQGDPQSSDRSNLQVIHLNSDSFQMKEEVQKDEDGTERLVKVMVIDWNKVPSNKS